MAANHLDIHFLNVGHGDCTILDLPSGNLTMIDVNNSKSLPQADEEALAEDRGITLSAFKSAAAAHISWENYYEALLVDPSDYLAGHFGDRSIFRYIQTHPDMDHMSGLCRLFWDDDIELLNFWDVAHAKEWEEEDFDSSRYAWVDWLMYRALRNGKRKNGQEHKVINNLQGGSGSYWTPDNIEVWCPTQELIDDCDTKGSWNDASYVLRVSFGGRSVVLPGDAEAAAWDSILDHADDMSCDILKASHHGRLSGYDESAVSAMNPSMVICSVGKKPSTDAANKYRSHAENVLSTRYHGTIVVEIWNNGEVFAYDHNGEQIAHLPRLT